MSAAEELAALKATFRSHGWYERPTSRVVLELAYHVAVFLAGIEWIQCYLPGHVPEITDPLMALGCGIAFQLAARQKQERPDEGGQPALA